MHVISKGTFIADRVAEPQQCPQQWLAGYRGVQSCTKGRTRACAELCRVVRSCAELVLAAKPWTSVETLKGFLFPGIL